MKGFQKKGGDILSHITAVPSAQAGLTTLFGMGRGEPRRNNHLKVVSLKSKVLKSKVSFETCDFRLWTALRRANILTYWDKEKSINPDLPWAKSKGESFSLPIAREEKCT